MGPRPVNSPLARPLPVLFSSTINIVVSMLETGTPTRFSLTCSTPSSKTTMESLLTVFTPATWTSPRSMATLTPKLLSTPPESVLVAALMDLDCLLESPSNRDLMMKAFANLTGDLAGTYYPLTGMSEKVRQQLVD